MSARKTFLVLAGFAALTGASAACFGLFDRGGDGRPDRFLGLALVGLGLEWRLPARTATGARCRST